MTSNSTSQCSSTMQTISQRADRRLEYTFNDSNPTALPNKTSGNHDSQVNIFVRETSSSGAEYAERNSTTGGNCWQEVVVGEGPSPGTRAAHSCDVIGGNKLLVFGGWTGRAAMNDVYILDTQLMTWKKANTSHTPPERNNHATAVINHRLYAHGGHDGSKWLDDLYVLETENLSWMELTLNGQAPSARACHTLSRVNDRLYMFGGYDGSQCFNEIDILDLETMSWIQPKVTGELPEARNAHTMSAIDTKLFLCGGHSGNKHLTDLHIFDTTTLRWSQPEIQGSPPPGLRGHSANLIGDRIVIFGGYDGKGRTNDIYILETVKMKWVRPQDSGDAPAGRQRHTACLVGSKRLFIFGGFDGTKWLNDLHILDAGKLAVDELTDTAIRNLLQNLRKLVCNPEFSDITIIVEGREIPAHRNILAAQCEYFRSMFSNNMRESTEKRITIPHWSYNAFVAMIEYLYTGRVSETSPLVVCETLGVADQYALDGLKLLCENILRHSIDAENVCILLQHADKFQAIDLKAACEHYILKHAVNVIKTKSFDELARFPHLMHRIAALSLSKSIRDLKGAASGESDGPGGVDENTHSRQYYR